MLRRSRKAEPVAVDPLAHVDPTAVPVRYQVAVAEALAVRQRWAGVVEGIRPGPTRDRLAELAHRVDAGVVAVWDTVARAAEIDRVAATLDADRVTDDYKRAKRDPAADPALVDALKERFESVQRLLNATDGIEDRLRLLDARLGAAVANAAEVALAAAPDGADALGAELESVIDELGALGATLTTL